MDRKFMAGGIFQFLDEVYEQGRFLLRYGNLIGKGELTFDEALIANEAEICNVLSKAGKRNYSRDSLMDW